MILSASVYGIVVSGDCCDVYGALYRFLVHELQTTQGDLSRYLDSLLSVARQVEFYACHSERS